jgi:hypothetical protein
MPRTLWYLSGGQTHTLDQARLIDRKEPLIILGEAGMGKSHLMEDLAQQAGYVFCTARKLINRPDPSSLLGDAQVLVIDALDEVGASGDGDAVDRVLQQLGRLAYPHFVLSCRVSEWRSATAVQAVKEQYDLDPLELHLTPFTDEDAAAFLAEDLGVERSRQVIDHFNQRGLEGLLGNPQTLQLIARVAKTSLPDSKSQLFIQAIELLRVEHRDEKANAQPARSAALDAAGAAFAAIILTGSEAISLGAVTDWDSGDLAIKDVEQLPGASLLQQVLGTRLFKAYSSKRFSYWHRRIGECLGAQWLAKQANTPRKRRRLLALFGSAGLVPASLRGLHAWLAQDPELAPEVIQLDPLGFIEYGDVDGLSARHAGLLLEALLALAVKEPHRQAWGAGSAKGLFRHNTMAALRHMIVLRQGNFGLRHFLIRGIQGPLLVGEFTRELEDLALSADESYAIRHAAFEALVEGQLGALYWAAFISKLQALGDGDSHRLAIEVLDTIGYDIASDQAISDLVVSNSIAEERLVGLLFPTKRSLPVTRIPGVLAALAMAANRLGKPHSRSGDRTLTDFAFNLATRGLQAGEVTARQLWTWMKVFNADAGYDQELFLTFNTLLRDNDELRHEVQRIAIFERTPGDSVWGQGIKLSRICQALQPSADDVVWLLDTLPSGSEADWRELVTIVRHDAGEGVQVREAAKRFVTGDAEAEQWLMDLANPPIPDWQIEEEQRKAEHKRERGAAQLQAQSRLGQHVQALERGEFSWIIEPAHFYLQLAEDVERGLPPHLRVSRWLGDELAEAAFKGFEAYLRSPQRLSCKEVSDAIAENKYYEAQHALIAALAEHLRVQGGLLDVEDDALAAAFLIILRTRLDDFAGLVGLKSVIEDELSRRSMTENVFRTLIEPQLVARNEPAAGLSELLYKDHHHLLARRLAADWLEHVPGLTDSVEAELATKLVRSGSFGILRRLIAPRLTSSTPAKLQLWRAVSVIADFEATGRLLDDEEIDPALLWGIRDLAGASRYRDKARVGLSVAQCEWILKTFREAWPLSHPPARGWSGDRNAWDAGEYLMQVMTHLARDPSEEAGLALQRLVAAAQDDFTPNLQILLNEQRQLRMETIYQAPSLAAVDAITHDAFPAMASDLQAFMMEELDIVQRKVHGDDAESWRGFFDDQGRPRPEEWCRDHLLGLLRQGSEGVHLDPEVHMPGDKEADITCSLGNMRIPIEIKGQWHRELWTGADSQLDRLYAADWRAERRGIYLVLWFGTEVPGNKRLATVAPGLPEPATAKELRDQLAATSAAAIEGRVLIYVLDLCRTKVAGR